MEGETAWHSIEGAIKNLSSAIQSLPEEFKAKALKLLDTQLTNSSEQLSWSSGNEGSLSLKQESEEEKNESLLSLFASVTAASNSDPAVAEASTSSVLAEKRRRCRQQRNRTNETASDDVGVDIKKSLRSGPPRRAACRFDEKPAVKVTRQSTKELKRNKKNASRNILTEEAKKSTKADLKKMNNSNNIKTEEDDKKLMAAADVPDAAFLTSSFDHQTEKQEMLTDSAADIMASVLKNRKRGRPRKLDICSAEIKTEEDSLKDLDISDVKEIIRHKKPGRPRQSSYSCGYVPKTKTFHCSECGKMLATKQSYREHQRQHTGEGFICDNCGQKFTTNSGFMLHKRYHSDDPHMYKCSKCKYIVSSQQLLDDHYQLRHDPNRPKSHICDVCGKAFHGSTQLEKHLFSHSNTKPYACDQCSFSTAYPGGLEKHKYNVHVADRKLFRCELCGIQLKSKGTYIEHIGRHFNQRKKKCEVCEKTFPNASQLAAHRRCHLEPTVPCEICGKKLRSKHKLKVHELIHTGQKDFGCPYCSYVTYVKHNLKKHCMARHKVDFPPLTTPKMKKFKLSEVSSDGLKDPLALKCLRKLNSNGPQEPMEAQDSIESVTPGTTAGGGGGASTALIEEAVLQKPEINNPAAMELIPMTKVEMINNVNEPKTFVADDKMYVAMSTIDRNAILDFHPGTFYTTSLYLPTMPTMPTMPTLVTGDQQLT